jgi:hypothetical protein
MNDHVKLLETYLEELCGHIERHEPLPKWKQWRKRALQAATPIAIGLTFVACEGDVEDEKVPTTECSEDTCDAQCVDHKDNDADRLVDCDDPDCAEVVACQGTPIYSAPTETCDDKQDNDGDGFVDCDDPDCSCAVALYMVYPDRQSLPE